MADFAAVEQSLRDEQEVLQRGGMDGMRLILTKLDEAADGMLAEYDACDFANDPARAMHIQIFRRVVKDEIPRMVTNIMNVDRAPEHKFNFWTWLKSAITRKER